MLIARAQGITVAMDPLRSQWETIIRGRGPDERVRHAGAILDLCRSYCRPVPEVEALAAALRDPDRWKNGHTLFDAIRQLTLAEEKRPTDRAYGNLLFVAENVAKTVYNATDPRDPFDEDAVLWVAPCARDMAAALKDVGFEERIWRAMRGES